MEELKNQVKHYLSLISDDQYVQSALIVLLAFFTAKIANFIIDRIVIRTAGRTKNQLDDFIIASTKKPLTLSILLVGMQLALERSLPGQHATGISAAIFSTIAILFWAQFAIRVSRQTLAHFSGDTTRFKLVQRHTLPLFDNLAIIGFSAAAIYFVFVAWDIDVSAWVASAGILGLGLSLAAKDTLANLFAGVFILADTPYKIGDFIVLDSGERGCVTHIGIRSTRILTRDDVEITVPNAIMGNTKIINESAGPYTKYRIRIKVGVAYGSDIQEVREALMSVAHNSSDVEKDPQPRVRFRAMADSSLNFELLCWVADPVLRGRVSDKLNEAVYNELMKRKIEIPFPQQDVHIRSMPPMNQ